MHNARVWAEVAGARHFTEAVCAADVPLIWSIMRAQVWSSDSKAWSWACAILEWMGESLWWFLSEPTIVCARFRG